MIFSGIDEFHDIVSSIECNFFSLQRFNCHKNVPYTTV